MTKYTIFCLLGLALAAQGAREFLARQSASSDTSATDTSQSANSTQSAVLQVPLVSTTSSTTVGKPDLAATTQTGSLLLASQQTVPDLSKIGETTSAKTVATSTPEVKPLHIDPTPPSARAEQPAANALSKTNDQTVAEKNGTPEQKNGSASPTTPATETTTVARPLVKDFDSLEPADPVAAKAAERKPLTEVNNGATLQPLDKAASTTDFPVQVTAYRLQIPLIQPGNNDIYGGQQNFQQPAAVDPNRMSANYEELRNPEQVKRDSNLSNEMLRSAQLAYQLQNFPEKYRLSGKELALQDLFYATTDRQQRFGLIKSYWKLALAMSEYHWAFDEYFALMQLEKAANTTGVNNTPSHRYISAAIYSSIARFSDMKSAAITSQYELMAMLGASRSPPIAVDVPLVGTYNTRFEANFPEGRTAPQRLKSINATIDLRRDVINIRAIANERTFEAWTMAQKAYMNSASEQNAQVVALAYEQLTRHRKAFLAAVRDYNWDIAEYSLLTSSTSIRPEGLATQLLRTPSRPLWNTQATNDGNRDYTVRAPSVVEDRNVRQATFSDAEQGVDFSRRSELPPSVMKQK